MPTGFPAHFWPGTLHRALEPRPETTSCAWRLAPPGQKRQVPLTRFQDGTAAQGPLTLPERIHPDLVIIDQDMRFFDFIRGHFLDHFLKGDCRIGIAADGGERVPHIGPHQIRRGHPPADFVIPADPGLGARMPLHGTSEIPFKSPLIVPLHAEPHGIKNADQFLRIRIAGPGRRPQFGHCLFKAARLHQIARLFDVRGGGTGQKPHKQGQAQTKLPAARKQSGVIWYGLHVVWLPLIALISSPALAAGLPEPLTTDDFILADRKQAALGQLLFYDRILSGNRNIACATCHHPAFGTSDGLSLGIGEGGVGLGPQRSALVAENRIKKRIPRNAPGLWNIGAKSIRTMFHDGRLSLSDVYGNGFNSPAEEWLPDGLPSLLAAQALFPLVAQFEMAGNPKENEIAGAIHDRIDAAWPILAKRVRILPGYGRRFVEAFEHIKAPEEVTIVEIAAALAAFQTLEWTSYDSPFDRYLAGDTAALTSQQQRGLDLFYGKAGCVSCHSGQLLSDQKFHALGLPPFGPGRTRRFDPVVRDVGRMGESDRLEDAYRFRTPMLRNVELTAPYGHNGAYSTLEGIVRHHLAPGAMRAAWQPATANLPSAPWLEAIDFIVWSDRRELARQARFQDLTPVDLADADVAALVAFLKALTGTRSVTSPPFGIPDRVPSGLPVDR